MCTRSQYTESKHLFKFLQTIFDEFYDSDVPCYPSYRAQLHELLPQPYPTKIGVDPVVLFKSVLVTVNAGHLALCRRWLCSTITTLRPKRQLAIVGLPTHSAPTKRALAHSRHRSTAPSPSCKPPPPPPQLEQPPAVQESIWDDSSLVFDPLPDNWDRYAKALATLAGASALNEAELRALQPVPRTLRVPTSEDEREGEGEGAPERPATRARAAIGRKVEFSLRSSRKQYLRKYGVPMYALLSASEDALREHVVGGGARVLANVNLKRVRIRFIWPQPPTSSASNVVYDEWVRIDGSVTKVQLAMRVAKVFNGFVEQQKIGDLSRGQTFKWRLRPDALYRTWLTRLERVETNVFVADLRYALSDP